MASSLELPGMLGKESNPQASEFACGVTELDAAEALLSPPELFVTTVNV